MHLIDRAVIPYPLRSDRPLVYAHRGASARAPENTLEAFELAATEGADGVELDVMVCGSGEVVVVHDVVLDRLAHSNLNVLHTPLAELRKIDVARHFMFWRERARIPTLDEVLEAIPGLLVNIELKDDRRFDAGLARKVAAIVRAHRAQERVVISSFNPLELARIRVFAPRLPLAFLFESQGSIVSRTGLVAPFLLAQAVHPEYVLLDALRILAWKLGGFRIAAWTVDDETRATNLATMGVDALVTNRPREILAALERRG